MPSRFVLLCLLSLLAVIEAHAEAIAKAQQPLTQALRIHLMWVQVDMTQTLTTRTRRMYVDPNCAAAGEGGACNKQTPPGGLTYGRCCYSSGLDPQYLYCRTHWWYPSRWRTAKCYHGNCIQMDPENDYMVCGYTS